MSSGAEIRLLYQWDLGEFFLNLKKKSQSQKKKTKKNFFLRIFIQSPHTHKLHNNNLLSLHLIAKVFVIANLLKFKLTKNAVIVCLKKFPI